MTAHQPPFTHLPARPIRRFYLYKENALALMIEDQPGRLHSMASPPPEGVPQHPFLQGTAFAALLGGEQFELLEQAADFDHFLELLIAADYDVVSGTGPHRMNMTDGQRLWRDNEVVGAVWPQAGQFTTLWWQPLADDYHSEWATLTVYRPSYAVLLLEILQAASGFAHFSLKLEQNGFRLASIYLNVK